MYEERRENGRGFVRLFLLVVVIAAIMIIGTKSGWFFNGNKHVASEQVKHEVVEESNAEKSATQNTITISKSEWNEMRRELRQMKEEINQLKQVSAAKSTATSVQEKTTVSVKTEQKAQTKTEKQVQVKEEEHTTINANDVTLTKYSHDWLDREATIALKNNTGKTITLVSGRMYYYDMDGNMLDYQDFTKSVTIEPGLVKTFTLRGYNHEENYVYYQSKVRYGYEDRKYKVKFELKSYRTR